MKKTIPVIGMACSVCSANVEKKLQSLEGINSASVSLASRTALVDYNPDIISLEDMKREISNAGYDLVIENDRSVEEINRREFTLLRRRTLASWLFAILTMCFSMGWISLGMEQNMISDGVASAHHSSSFANQICLLLALANLLSSHAELSLTRNGASQHVVACLFHRRSRFAADHRFIYNIICIPLAAGVLHIFGIDFQITPMWASALMAFSSVSVVLNSLRLRLA